MYVSLNECLNQPCVFQYVSVYINAGQTMMFGGSTDNCAQCSLTSIGQLGQEENKRHTAALMEKINRDLKIPVDR